MSGFEHAREAAGLVGMAPEDIATLAGFDAWLAARANYDLSHGSWRWPSLVKQFDSTEKSAVTFFRLFEEFLQSTGRSLSDVKPWEPSGFP